MKIKLKGQKVILNDWKKIKHLQTRTLTSLGVDVEFEIQIEYPEDTYNNKIRRNTFTYKKENEMIKDYQRLLNVCMGHTEN